MSIIALQFNMQGLGYPKHERAGLRESQPLAAALPLLTVTLLHDARIKADTGIVQKNVPINFADIDPGEVTGKQDLYRPLELKRDAEIPGKMVESPHRQHAENSVLSNHRCCYGCGGSIPATAYDRPIASASLFGQSREISSS